MDIDDNTSTGEDAASQQSIPVTSAKMGAASAGGGGGAPAASGPTSLHLTSDEVNYLIFRYMQESGFTHSAFTFVYESMLGRSHIRNSEKSVPPGALVSFLQKGLQYVGIEETVQREMQEMQRQQQLGKKKTANEDTPPPPIAESVMNNLSLLAPQTIGAMTRENPPLQLNIPPATAAAAVKARLEAEAQLEKERKEKELKEARTRAIEEGAESNASGQKSRRVAGPQSIPPQPSILTNPLEQATAYELQAAQAAMIQQQQQQAAPHPPAVRNTHTPPPGHPSHLASANIPHHPTPGSEPVSASAGAAALMAAQQRRALTQEIAILEQQREAHMQLQLQQQLQQEQERLRQEAAAHAIQRQQQIDAAADAQAALQRTVGTKKTPKNKVKNPKKAVVAGFATPLASNGASQDITMGDASEETSAVSNEEQQQSLHLQQHQQLSEGANVQALLNGKHPQFNGGDQQHIQKTTPSAPAPDNAQHQQAAVTAPPPDNGARPPAGSTSLAAQKTPEELSIIDREDELTKVNPSEVLELKMHQSEVFMCAWNGFFTDLIATGSGDASARIWKMGGAKAADGLGPVRLLPHGSGPKDRKNKDVTTLEWSSDGKLLATGSYDGVARVWNLDGALVHTLRGHKGPIFSLKWNKKGNFLLSGSYDKTTIVWDVSGSNGFIEQQFNDHTAPALDVDWKDDTTFASCSTDKTVHICRVGMPRPLKTYTGHTDEVNAVKWDPSGDYLASCSDDCTAKVWAVNSDSKDALFDLKSHQQEIYTVKWAPTGPGSANPEKHRMLATASFDGSVRLWSAEDGSCMQVFSRHRDSVYSVAFSPSGSFLASGSLAGQLYIWNIAEGKHIKSFKGKGDIFEVAWNKEETRVAACFSSNVVCIIDFP
eukprot:CAMPEP_0113479668 /NCGR_PEP_ID=MMETSP0014_2-20120614/21448_1 /TAXON_ID=2857 /ORGANISM="Nitzschia sp." /LENGTH=884 /DNA_ID=CAMNT_0000373013 /DNA_START=383 /DNA_END=3037 /DNA_ORIENTATION=+ /assembly_acc=CAM_ASM_000159